MDMLNAVAEALLYILPALAVILTVYIVLGQLVKKEELKEQYMMKNTTLTTLLPLRLSAYERGILFLERIAPQNLIPRSDGSQKPARAFQSQLLHEIRSEYEHNIAQQLYITVEGWEDLTRAKEEIIGLINHAASQMQQNSTGLDLSRAILEHTMKMEELPTERAILTLKKDIHKLFR